MKPAVPRGRRLAFDSELRRLVLVQHHHGQVTVPQLTALLAAMRISIPKRQVLRPLIVGQDEFVREAGALLRRVCRPPAGSRWMTQGPVTSAGMASGRISATTTSPVSGQREAKAV
jgi:hypothetical protein